MTQPLPEGYTERHASPADIDAVLELITACDLLDYGEPDYTREDLLEEWEEVELPTGSWLVHAPSGQLAGYIKLDHRDHVRPEADGYVHPDQRGRGIGTHLIERTESRAWELAPLAPPGIRVTLSNATNSADEQAVALLRHAFGEFHQRGWCSVALGVDSESPTGATKLYEKAGMRVIRQFDIHHLELRPVTKLPSET